MSDKIGLVISKNEKTSQINTIYNRLTEMRVEKNIIWFLLENEICIRVWCYCWVPMTPRQWFLITTTNYLCCALCKIKQNVPQLLRFEEISTRRFIHYHKRAHNDIIKSKCILLNTILNRLTLFDVPTNTPGPIKQSTRAFLYGKLNEIRNKILFFSHQSGEIIAYVRFRPWILITRSKRDLIVII